MTATTSVALVDLAEGPRMMSRVERHGARRRGRLAWPSRPKSSTQRQGHLVVFKAA